MNKIWSILIVLAIVFGILNNRINEMSEALFNVPKETLKTLLQIGSMLIIYSGLFQIAKESWSKVVLAYEPVWAIGTGETASPEQAQEMHEFIREVVRKAYGADIADEVSILYGGSVKPDNAKEIFGKPDVDGGLIGGAALKADDFLAIVTAI